MKKIDYIVPFGLLLIFLLIIPTVKSQEIENEFQLRTSLKLGFKLVKHVKVSFVPEIRFNDDFSVDKYQMEGAIDYRAFKLVSFGGSYRFVVNLRDVKETEYLSRYALDVTFKKKFDRFKPSFRFQYTNDNDDDEDAASIFMRYKASLEYNIPKTKITPTVGVEAFQQLDDGQLYKMRYSLGFDYKLFKHNYIGLGYKLDFYMNEYKNKHIVEFQYVYSF